MNISSFKLGQLTGQSTKILLNLKEMYSQGVLLIMSYSKIYGVREQCAPPCGRLGGCRRGPLTSARAPILISVILPGRFDTVGAV